VTDLPRVVFDCNVLLQAAAREKSVAAKCLNPSLSRISIDEQARQAAVEEITSSNKALRKKFGIALQRYIARQTAAAAEPSSDWVDRAFVELLNGCNAVATADAGVSADDAGVAVQPATVAEEESAASALLSASQTLRERFEAALKCYLSQQAAADVKLDENLIEDAFKNTLRP